MPPLINPPIFSKPRPLYSTPNFLHPSETDRAKTTGESSTPKVLTILDRQAKSIDRASRRLSLRSAVIQVWIYGPTMEGERNFRMRRRMRTKTLEDYWLMAWSMPSPSFYVKVRSSLRNFLKRERVQQREHKNPRASVTIRWTWSLVSNLWLSIIHPETEGHHSKTPLCLKLEKWATDTLSEPATFRSFKSSNKTLVGGQSDHESNFENDEVNLLDWEK